MRFTQLKTEHPLQGKELQKKEAQKEKIIHEICLQRTYS